ncbi:MAG: patatin-like phospholipase family protein, partial [Gemmatimonadales bacterium]
IESLARNFPIYRLFLTSEPRVPHSLGLLQPLLVWEWTQGSFVLQRAAVQEGEISALLTAGLLPGSVRARSRFDSLPIRFRAVATDLLTGEPFVFDSGDLARAVKASSAIPLLIDPEHIGERYFGDGGLSENVPIRVAREAGAARVIVSFTTEPEPDSLNLESPLVVADQLVGLLFRQPLDSLAPRDLTIHPDVEGFKSLDFSPAAVVELIARGHEAAVATLDSAQCLPRAPRRSGPLPRYIGRVTFHGAEPSDTAYLQRSLDLVAGERLRLRELQSRIRVLGQNERFKAVWLESGGSGDSVSFRVTPRYASTKVFAIGAAYDNDLGGRVWLGGVHRDLFGSGAEGSAAVFLGEFGQGIAAGLRGQTISGRTPVPVLDLRARRELIRRFTPAGEELSAFRVHEASVFAGVEQILSPRWTASVGAVGRVWDEGNGRQTAGGRLAIWRVERPAEPVLQFDVEVTGRYTRIALDGFATLSLGRLDLQPHIRYGYGRDLPVQLAFPLGGFEGFPGLHIGENRGAHEALGSLVISYPLFGAIRFRVEPVVGLTSTAGNAFPEGTALWGVRTGLNIDTPLGPVRAEYGLSKGKRDGILVRIGRWF